MGRYPIVFRNFVMSGTRYRMSSNPGPYASSYDRCRMSEELQANARTRSARARMLIASSLPMLKISPAAVGCSADYNRETLLRMVRAGQVPIKGLRACVHFRSRGDDDLAPMLECNDIEPALNQCFSQVRPDKSGAPCDQSPQPVPPPCEWQHPTRPVCPVGPNGSGMGGAIP